MSENNQINQEAQELNEILQKLQSTQELADRDLTNADWRTRSGLEIQKSDAKRKLEDHIVEYSKAISKTVHKLFLNTNSEQANQLADLLNKEKVFALVAPSLYEEIAIKVKQTMGNNPEFGAGAYFKMIEFIADFARRFRVNSVKPLKQVTGVITKTNEDVLKIVKEVTRDAFGDSLNKAYLTSVFTELALKSKFNKNVSIVIFPNVNEEEKKVLSENLFSGQPSFSIIMADGEEVNKSLALKVFRRVYETQNNVIKTKKEE